MPPTTCADVSANPSGVMTTADPAPSTPAPRTRWRTRRLATDGIRRSATEVTTREYASSASSSGSMRSSISPLYRRSGERKAVRVPRDDPHDALRTRETMSAVSAERHPRLLPVAEEARVTPIELFFDLVFVFSLTQVTALMGDRPHAARARARAARARAALVVLGRLRLARQRGAGRGGPRPRRDVRRDGRDVRDGADGAGGVRRPARAGSTVRSWSRSPTSRCGCCTSRCSGWPLGPSTTAACEDSSCGSCRRCSAARRCCWSRRSSTGRRRPSRGSACVDRRLRRRDPRRRVGMAAPLGLALRRAPRADRDRRPRRVDRRDRRGRGAPPDLVADHRGVGPRAHGRGVPVVGVLRRRLDRRRARAPAARRARSGRGWRATPTATCTCRWSPASCSSRSGSRRCCEYVGDTSDGELSLSLSRSCRSRALRRRRALPVRARRRSSTGRGGR